MTQSNIIISKDFTFEASHVLPKHAGKCSRLHGHSWQLIISIIGKTDPASGFVMDYSILKSLIQDYVIINLDHSHLGHGAVTLHDGRVALSHFGNDFYPSSENLVVAIAKIIQSALKENNHEHIRLYEVELKETCTSSARYRPDDEYC